MAIHPQYSGETLKQYAHNPFCSLINKSKFMELMEDELLINQKLAIKSGCTRTNSWLFVIDHIYPQSHPTKNSIKINSHMVDKFAETYYS